MSREKTGVGEVIEVDRMSLDDMRTMIGRMITKNPQGGRLWDILTCLRGPDSPSERGDQPPAEHAEAYRGRRERKFKTVEVIRARAFFGMCGGGARHHEGTFVTLPNRARWDHFDRHVARAANTLGLEVRLDK